MPKLTALIAEVNKSYDLNLSDTVQTEVLSRLKFAGVPDDVSDQNIKKTVDTIVALSDTISKSKAVTAVTAASIYSELKAEAEIPHDQCAICGSSMGDAAIVNSRQVKYCQSCHVVMPIKVS